ncbi:MAG: FHA domain-containing protein, partial [Bacteroidota bacterium]
RTAQSYTLGAGVGIGLVSMLLIIFSLLYPKLQQINFRKKHLKPYQPQAGRQVMDPLTREPIQAGEMVVDICRLAIPWQTWQECGHTCPRFPGCTTSNLQCKGHGGVATSGFFSLQGPHRRLNWIWYGALGGFIAWIIAGFVFVFGQNLVSSLGLAGADDLIEDTMLGAAFGFGISLMLSIIEERTESRRFSISRILMRTLLATVLAIVVFGGSYMLFDSGAIASPLIVGAIAWVFLGLSIGFVLSLFGSSVSLGRGLIGGLLAGIVGFGCYTLLGELSEDFLLAKVVSLVSGGAVLGGILDTVVQLSESYEMEFLQPATYRRNVPLSKWLGTGSEIIIGTQPGSQVYVKWPDEAVLPEHAKIKLEGERVFLIPMAETLVNGHIVNQKRIQLQDKDLIQLGRNAITQMRFLQKQEAK